MTTVFNTKTITIRALIAAAATSAAVAAGPAHAFDLSAFQDAANAVQEDLQGVAEDAFQAGMDRNARHNERLGVQRSNR